MGNEPRTDGRDGARERFFALLADELADERARSEDDLRFSERAAAEDLECRAFSALIGELRRPEPVAPAEIDRAIHAHRSAARGSRRNGLIAFAVTTASIAAAAAIVVAVAFREPGAPRSDAPDRGPAFFLAAEDGAAAGAGNGFETAGAPLLLHGDDDVTVGLDRASSIRVVALDASAVSLRLDRGRVAIHFEPGGSRSVTVITPLCEVSVTGTVFSVAVEPGEVLVAVVRGSVVISEAPHREIARVGAGQSFAVSTRDTDPLDGGAADAILALLRMGGARPEAPLTARAEASPAVAPDAPVPAVDESAASPQKPAGDELGRNGKGAAATSSGAEAPAATPADLIRRARERVRARDWEAAAALYRQIVRDFPAREEAITVRVPLAEIELDHLGSPGTALTDYRHYLAAAANGPLAEDALFGVCAALKRLGRNADEARSLAEFLRRFPQSLHASSAKIRLNELGGRSE